MKKHNLLSIIVLITIILSCDDKKKSEENYFKFNNAVLKVQYQPQEAASLEIVNTNNKTIDSVVYFVNDKKVGVTKESEKLNFLLRDQKLGYQNLKALVYFEKKNQEVIARIELVSEVEPKLLSYTIVNTYPHDNKAFTQGLEFYRDTLYEGTGRYGVSSLRKTDYKTGKVYKQVNLDPRHFGEGITILNNKVYQLTWKENIGIIYNADTFEKEKEFSYFKSIEGWGLCNDGKVLYQSDGTEKIWIIDPTTLKEIDYINVYTASNKIKNINELEYINGKIYGNIWGKNAIAVINPKNGTVEAVINLAELKTKIFNPNQDTDNVLNGIAYNPKTKTIFITGKNWDKMFEIKVNE